MKSAHSSNVLLCKSETFLRLYVTKIHILLFKLTLL